MHPNEQLLRKAYADFAKGDLDGYLSACDAGFTFHVPGKNAMGGTYEGRAGMQGLVQKLMGIVHGEFMEVVEDCFANDRNGVVLVLHQLKRAGRSYEYRSAHVYELAGGRALRAYEQPRSQAEFDASWGP